MNRSTPPSTSAFACSRKILFRFVDAGLAPRLDANTQRPDRAGDVGLVARRVPRDLCALHVDRVHAVGEPERASFTRLAPKVLVSMTSAPART